MVPIANCLYSNSQNNRFYVKTKMYRHGFESSRTRSTCIEFLFPLLQANYGWGGANEKKKFNFLQFLSMNEMNSCVNASIQRMDEWLYRLYRHMNRVLSFGFRCKHFFFFASAVLRFTHLVFSSFRLQIISTTTTDWVNIPVLLWGHVFSHLCLCAVLQCVRYCL